MAFIILKRSRNTKGFYLVESHRDGARVRLRTLCYLGREQDGTDSLAKALAHWEQVAEHASAEFRSAKGKRRDVIRRRGTAAKGKTALLKRQIALEAEAVALRIEQKRLAEEAVYWQAIERLRWQPGDENARAAKKAFFTLAKVYHPDQGGTHEGFLRLKAAYDRATAAWNRMAA